VGEDYAVLKGDGAIVKSVTGGVNLASRTFYEHVGDQDEQLFMYSDEIDVGLKAKRSGYKMFMAYKAKAWHQHENPPGKTRRSTVSDYLMARNKVYLAGKYYGNMRKILVITFFVFHNLYRSFKCLLRGRSLDVPKQSLKGARDGLRGKMGKPILNKNNNYERKNTND
jgi:GT2 family glycosyltransferase